MQALTHRRRDLVDDGLEGQPVPEGAAPGPGPLDRREQPVYYDAIDRKDLDTLGRCVTDGVVSHYAGAEGREAWLQYFQALFEGFPDHHADVLGITADDGSAAGRATFTGTHEGDFNGIPATGRQVTMEGADFVRLDADGRIAEHWAYGDSMVLLQQLGVVPQPA